MYIPIKTELIINYINENNLTKVKFCNLCGISKSTLNRILSKNKNFKLISLFKIAKILKINIHLMFEKQNNIKK